MKTAEIISKKITWTYRNLVSAKQKTQLQEFAAGRHCNSCGSSPLLEPGMEQGQSRGREPWLPGWCQTQRVPRCYPNNPLLHVQGLYKGSNLHTLRLPGPLTEVWGSPRDVTANLFWTQDQCSLWSCHLNLPKHQILVIQVPRLSLETQELEFLLSRNK